MKPCCPVPIHARVRHVVSRAFFRYGHVVGRFPWPFLVVPVLVLGGLGAGLMNMEQNDAYDDINIPRDTQSFKDQAKVKHLFPDRTGDHYDALELNEDQIMGSIIFRARHNASVYDDDVIQEIRDVIADVKANVTTMVNGVTLKYEDLCGRRHNACVVTGERLLAPQFNAMRKMGILTYPKWKLPTTGDMVDLSFALADSDSELNRVGVARVTFKLRHDRQPQVFLWEEAFVRFLLTKKTNRSDIVFSASSSISLELESSFHTDVFFVWLCLGVVAFCSMAITWGGDVVSTRALLVPMGVVSPALGVVAALGVLSFCEVKVVQMVWVGPLLVLAKGVTDMSILMTSWSSRLDRAGGDVAQRVGWCLYDVGSSITVTSLSLFVAFCAGYTSSSLGVANFCLYVGVAVAFCYLSTMTFGVGCLAVHTHRVISSRHTVTCHVTRSRDQLRKEGKPLCAAIVCGGSLPKEKYGDQSVLEVIPRLVLVKVTGSVIARVVIGILYLGVLAASVFGVVNMKQGVELKTLVDHSTYIHKYLTTDARYFGFSFPVVFVMDENVRYNQKTADMVVNLVDKAKEDPGIQNDFVRCWIVNFLKSDFYNLTTEGEDFPGKVVEDFLMKSETFVGDVVLDETGEWIVASRCYVFTKKSSDQEKLTRLMKRMRKLAAEAEIPVFAYHPAFLNYDQRLAMLPSLFQTVGITIAVLCAVYLVFFPEIVTALVTVTVAMSIMLGTIGLMNFLDVSLSFVSMTHIVLNTGFAVLFSVYVGAAYLQSEFSARADRVADAVSRAAAPTFMGALCVVAGVLLFIPAVSYSFSVLFKVTLLTLLMSIFLSVFFTPMILSFVGCEKSREEMDKDKSLNEDLLRQNKESPISENGHAVRAEDENERNAIATLPHTQQGYGDSNTDKNWSDYVISPTEANMRVIGNGTAGERYTKMLNGRKPLTDFPKADYENVSIGGTCPHGLSSNSYKNARKSLPSNGYYNTFNQYENWQRRNTASRDLYDLPISFPSERREGLRTYGIMDTDFRNPPQPVRPLRRKDVAPLIIRKRPTSREMKEPKSLRQTRRKEEIQADIVASLNNMDDDFHESPYYEPVASLEDVHHVACTLSTNGGLGATQAYVTENFHDIPS